MDSSVGFRLAGILHSVYMSYGGWRRLPGLLFGVRFGIGILTVLTDGRVNTGRQTAGVLARSFRIFE